MGKWMPVELFCAKCETQIDLKRVFINSEGMLLFYGWCEECKNWVHKMGSVFRLIFWAVEEDLKGDESEKSDEN